MLKLTNGTTTGPDGAAKPKLFVNSAIHAREYATAPLMLAFATQLLTGYGKDADATWILDDHEVHLLLQTNPDGRKKAEGGLLWRKNTNQAYCGANSNDRGADLNRNFTYSWNKTNGQGSSAATPAPRPTVAPRRAPSRRPRRSRAMCATSGRTAAARTRTTLRPPTPAASTWTSTATASSCCGPGASQAETAPNGTALQTLGRKFAFFNGYTPEQSIGLYPTDGTSDSVSYGELGVAAYTFEIGTSFFQSCTSLESTIKPKNLPALLYAAKVVRTPYLTPAGPDVSALKLSNKAAKRA